MANKTVISVLFMLSSVYAMAEAPASSTGGTNVFFWIIVVLLALVILTIASVGDRLLKITASQVGANERDYSIIPSWKQIVGESTGSHVDSSLVTVLRKGHDIKLQGEAALSFDSNVKANTYAIKPTDFSGIFPIPSMTFQVGDKVKAGDILFVDKRRAEIQVASPVSGEIIEIRRGDRRAITEIIILADKENQYKAFSAPSLDQVSREDLTQFLIDSGAWAFIRQRPFSIIADPKDNPKGIFISTFDTAPLAPDLNFALADDQAAFQKGLDVLNLLSSGGVHLGLNADSSKVPSPVFMEASGVHKHWFKGQHPAGNVGVQLHHISPLAKGETAWVINAQDVAIIGRLFTEGRYRAERAIALAGVELANPTYVKSYIGASLADLLANNASGENNRIISGDVLTGKQVSQDNYVGFYDDQVSVIEEGNYNEFFGWLLPLKPRPSISKTFPGAFFPDFKYKADTNTHGEERAFVVTGQYESVLPMDIYPQHLMKAILANDLESMEGLGILELDEEDVALCEFVCTSKQPVQAILRKGLDMMQEQG